MSVQFDTIVATATAAGPAAIAVVRVSGPEAAEIAGRVLFAGRTGPNMTFPVAESHRLLYGRAVSPTTGDLIDEVMVAWMAAPRSFTTEDMVEISCHGGDIAAAAIVRALIAAGGRPAEPGEFTYRAFVHGRVGLTEAEAVLQVVSAHSADGLQRALADLQGDLAQRIVPARAAVIMALAYLDASADFPDDEIPTANIAADLALAATQLESVLAGARTGRLLSEGATVALLGRPNVGKSSLLNALLRSDRAIVTPIAGTTRDVVSERAMLDGIPILLLDTAGIAASTDPIELAGIERSRSALQHAVGLVLVIDGSEPLAQDDLSLAEEISARFDAGGLGEIPLVIALNKADRPLQADLAELWAMLPSTVGVVSVSALTGAGLDQLAGAIGAVLRQGSDPVARPALLSERQYGELDRALLLVRGAQEALAAGFPTDLLATDVRLAARAIGRVTGEDIDDAVLSEIFSRFCIGK
ncbi:MAG TPA: tRNA uridine-5-carboxymethylaminomethyl(34) synthesis GTPase MnmE [Thermomicrobiales bacterium]|nr:tRNA uridine-5-carboxymethylaminomethyl(34) synthesis GTPase MnmE [Thermomicrobiales bacterium]